MLCLPVVGVVVVDVVDVVVEVADAKDENVKKGENSGKFFFTGKPRNSLNFLTSHPARPHRLFDA